MWRNFPKLIPLFCLALLTIGAGPANKTQIRGDYDGDGYQDVAVASVQQLSSGSKSYLTYMIAKGSAGKDVSYYLLSKTDAFANGKYFLDQPTALTSVLVTSSSKLSWTFIHPKTFQLVKLEYGVPSDHITNAINFDGDGLDDMYVVREGPANEFNDGKKYLHWLIAMSGSNGTVVDVLFGLKDDRVFTFYKDEKPHLAALRIEKSGACAGQFAWYYMNYDPDPAARTVGATCWGLPGDLPIIPEEIDGQLKVVVARPGKKRQVAYMRDFEGTASKTKILGLKDSIPGIVSLPKDGSSFFWHQRKGYSSGEDSYVTINNGSNTKFGTTSSIILKPDGSVVQPTDSGQLPYSKVTVSSGTGGGSTGGGSSNSPCSETVTRGYLWKPESGGTGEGTRDGFPMILFNYYYSSTNCLQVLAADYTPISCLGNYQGYSRFYEGYGCGNTSAKPCYGRTNAKSIADKSKKVGKTRGGYVLDPKTNKCYAVSDFGARVDRR